MSTGRRNRLVSILRATGTTTNDYGEEVSGGDEVVATAFAEILFGTGQERREAAQERASQAITVICAWNPTLAAAKKTDKMQAIGATWDIVSTALIGLNKEIHFGCVASQ